MPMPKRCASCRQCCRLRRRFEQGIWVTVEINTSLVAMDACQSKGKAVAFEYSTAVRMVEIGMEMRKVLMRLLRSRHQAVLPAMSRVGQFQVISIQHTFAGIQSSLVSAKIMSSE
jgi:hypothetical protein